MAVSEKSADVFMYNMILKQQFFIAGQTNLEIFELLDIFRFHMNLIKKVLTFLRLETLGAHGEGFTW